MEQFPHPPSFEAALGYGGVLALSKDIHQFQSIGDLRSYSTLYGDIYINRGDLGPKIKNVIDRIANKRLFEDGAPEVARGFMSGAVMAVRLAELTLPKKTFEMLPALLFDPEVDLTTTPDQSTFNVISQIIRVARNGYQAARDYHQVLGEWRDELQFDNEIGKEHFEFGFGFVFSAIRDLAEQESSVAFVLPRDEDWDAFANDPMKYKSETTDEQ